MKLTKYSQLKHGMRVRCEIYGKQVDDAKISIDKSGPAFVCQNEEDGMHAEDKLGYKYSLPLAWKDRWATFIVGLESIDEDTSRTGYSVTTASTLPEKPKSEWQAKYYKDNMWFTKDTVFIYGEELTVEGLKEKANAYRNILLAHNKKFPK